MLNIPVLGQTDLLCNVIPQSRLSTILQAALKAAKQTKDGRDEDIASLHSEIEAKISEL